MEAGRAGLPSYLELVERIDVGDRRAVWDQTIDALIGLDRLARGRPERPAMEGYARAVTSAVRSPRLGRRKSDDGEETLLRGKLIQGLGEFGDVDIVAEARRRFAGFVQNPPSLPAALRDAVIHVVGVDADRADYETLLALARRSTVTSDRVRYYYAAASARDPALAGATLALTLTDELPVAIVDGVIDTVASAGGQPDLAWDFVQQNLDRLTTRQGPSFRDKFIPIS